jgi:hypothetical protein
MVKVQNDYCLSFHSAFPLAGEALLSVLTQKVTKEVKRRLRVAATAEQGIAFAKLAPPLKLQRSRMAEQGLCSFFNGIRRMKLGTKLNSL